MYTRPATSDVEVTEFMTDSREPQAPVLPPRARCSTSILHWKEPPPSPPATRPWTGSNVFTDSMVSEFFGRSKSPTSHDVFVSTSMLYSQNDQPVVHRQDVTMPLDGNLVLPFTSSSSSAVVWDTHNDGGIDECTQTDHQSIAVLANSYSAGVSPPTRSDDIAKYNTASFHTGVDIVTPPSHPVTDIDTGVSVVNGDGLSAFCYSLDAQHDAVGACADNTQDVGLWKQFDNNAWQVEQDKLKQMSLDLPAESDSKDDQLPDLSSSNRLSEAALRLYDSIYGGQSAGAAAHRVPSGRSLSSLWMRDQNQYAAAHTVPDQPPASSVLHKPECGPCPAVHRAVESERNMRSSDAYSHNVGESASGNYQSPPSNFVSQSHLALQMSSAERLPVTEDKCDTDSILETFVATDDVGVGLAAEVISRLGLSEREFLAGDSLYDNYRWQTSAVPTYVSPRSDVLQLAVEDAVLARRPSIKELKSRFESKTSSSGGSVREAAARLPSTAARRHQFESASLRVGRRSFHGRTDHESGGHRQRRKPSLDTTFTDVIAPPHTAKNFAVKGRFVTRSSVAASGVVNFPVLSAEADVDQSEHIQFERLVDRRRVFETANTQPVA